MLLLKEIIFLIKNVRILEVAEAYIIETSKQLVIWKDVTKVQDISESIVTRLDCSSINKTSMFIYILFILIKTFNMLKQKKHWRILTLQESMKP